MYVALSLAFSAGYGALLTHYGNGAGVFTFSSGYVPQKRSDAGHHHGGGQRINLLPDRYSLLEVYRHLTGA